MQWVPFAEYLFQSTAYAQRSGSGRVARGAVARAAGFAAATVVLAVAPVGAAAAARIWDRGARGGAMLAAGAPRSLLEVCGFAAVRLLWWPDAWGNPVPSHALPWAGPRAYVNVNGGYAGVLSLPLAFVGLLCARRRPVLGSLGWLWLLGFVLGFEVPIASDLINRLPVLDLAQYRDHDGGLRARCSRASASTRWPRRRRGGGRWGRRCSWARCWPAWSRSPHVPWPESWPPAREWAEPFRRRRRRPTCTRRSSRAGGCSAAARCCCR
jgi:hypothetical protein